MTRQYPRESLQVAETYHPYYLPQYPFRVILWIKDLSGWQVKTLGYYTDRGAAEQSRDSLAKGVPHEQHLC